ncbi:MAG: hypothetical protein HZA00_10815 [Nitrospinae bacterium]|nr:hypothetical protein [Nitrospinota bacterium]
MTIDAKKWEEILREAGQETDDEFASKISSLTRLTDDEIKAITPNPGDKEKLAELMKIVSDATRNNIQKADAIRNTKGLAEIAVALLGKLI